MERKTRLRSWDLRLGHSAPRGREYHLREMFVFLNMFPINQPEVMIGNSAERFDAQGNLTNEATEDHIRRMLQNLVQWTNRLANR